MTDPGSGRTVTALVPAWRASAFIRSTLDGLAAQTHPGLRIVISDDASPDDTAAIGEAYAARDGRFRVIRQPRNLGWIGNVNALLARGDGDYLLFAFHDDILAPDYVARCVAALEANPRAILAFSDVTLVNPDGTSEARAYPELDGLSARLERARAVAQRRGWWWIPNRGVFRASAARAIGGLRRHLAGEYSADWPWLLHMSLLGEFVRIPAPLCTKVYTHQSLSRSWTIGVGPTIGVTLSALREVARAQAPVREKLFVGADLLRYAGRTLRQAAGRRARRAGPER